MIKKIVLGLMAMVCLTACDEDYTDWSAPQSSPQEDAQRITLNVTPCADIDLATVTADSLELAQISVDQPENFVTDSLALDVVAADGSTTPLSIAEGKVATADLTAVVTKEFGRRPELRTLNLKTTVYAWTSADKKARVSVSKNIEVKVKPVTPVFETAYYYIGALGTDKSHPMTKVADGVYTVTVPAYGDWHWFKIAPESGFGADGNFVWANEGNCLCASTKDDEAVQGKFVIGGDKYSWHMVEPEGAKSFTIKVDLYEMNYSITANN